MSALASNGYITINSASGGPVGNDKIPIYSPAAFLAECRRNRWEIESWYGRCNSLWLTRGRHFSRGWFLIHGDHIDDIQNAGTLNIALNPTADSGLGISRPPTIFKYLIPSEIRPLYGSGSVAPDHPDSKSLHIVEVVDSAARAINTKIKRIYNVPNPVFSTRTNQLSQTTTFNDPGAPYYLHESLDHRDAVNPKRWTYLLVVEHLFTWLWRAVYTESNRTGVAAIASRPDWRAPQDTHLLPSHPNLPYDLKFINVSVWEALLTVLSHAGCDIYHNLDDDKFYLIKLSQDDTTLNTLLNTTAYKRAFVCGYKAIVNDLYRAEPSVESLDHPIRFGGEKDLGELPVGLDNASQKPVRNAFHRGNRVTASTGGDNESSTSPAVHHHIRSLVSPDEAIINTSQLERASDKLEADISGRGDYEQQLRVRYHGLMSRVKLSSRIKVIGYHDFGSQSGLCTDLLSHIQDYHPGSLSNLTSFPPEGLPPLLGGKESYFSRNLPISSQSSGLAHAVFGNPSPYALPVFPSYPRDNHLVQIAQLHETGENDNPIPEVTAGDWTVPDIQSGTLYRGYVVRCNGYDSHNVATYERLRQCFITVLNHNGFSTPPPVEGEIFHGRLIGYHKYYNTPNTTDDRWQRNIQPLYVVEPYLHASLGIAVAFNGNSADPISGPENPIAAAHAKSRSIGFSPAGGPGGELVAINRGECNVNVYRPALSDAVGFPSRKSDFLINVGNLQLAENRHTSQSGNPINYHALDAFGQGIPRGSYGLTVPLPNGKQAFIPEPHPRTTYGWSAGSAVFGPFEDHQLAPQYGFTGGVGIERVNEIQFFWGNLDGGLYVLTDGTNGSQFRLQVRGWYEIEYRLTWGGPYSDLSDAITLQVSEEDGDFLLINRVALQSLRELITVNRATSAMYVLRDNNINQIVDGSEAPMVQTGLGMTSQAGSEAPPPTQIGGNCHAKFAYYNAEPNSTCVIGFLEENVPSRNRRATWHINDQWGTDVSGQVGSRPLNGGSWITIAYKGLWAWRGEDFDGQLVATTDPLKHPPRYEDTNQFGQPSDDDWQSVMNSVSRNP